MRCGPCVSRAYSASSCSPATTRRRRGRSAQQAGVDEVRAGLLPEDKVDAVYELAARYGPVGMVGDGVNDAPRSPPRPSASPWAPPAPTRPSTLPTSRSWATTSRRCRRRSPSRAAQCTIVRQNIALSIAIKAVFLALAPLGLVTLWMAVFADMGTSLLVIGNGMRLQRGMSTPPGDD